MTAFDAPLDGLALMPSDIFLICFSTLSADSASHCLTRAYLDHEQDVQTLEQAAAILIACTAVC
jgi:hypothetical protein